MNDNFEKKWQDGDIGQSEEDMKNFIIQLLADQKKEIVDKVKELTGEAKIKVIGDKGFCQSCGYLVCRCNDYNNWRSKILKELDKI